MFTYLLFHVHATNIELQYHVIALLLANMDEFLLHLARNSFIAESSKHACQALFDFKQAWTNPFCWSMHCISLVDITLCIVFSGIVRVIYVGVECWNTLDQAWMLVYGLGPYYWSLIFLLVILWKLIELLYKCCFTSTIYKENSAQFL